MNKHKTPNLPFRARVIFGALFCLVGIAFAFLAIRQASAQNDNTDTPQIKGAFRGVLPVMKFDVSPALRDIEPIAPNGKGALRENEDREIVPIKMHFAPEFDPVVQTTVGGKSGRGWTEIPGPLISFDGQPNGAGVAPPDPNGAVGPNHVVTMANLTFQIFSKTGTSLFGPANNNTLWSGFGGPCQTENSGDPVVLYDRLADRWFLSQFTSAGPTYFFCVAISTSPDPTGTYYRYAVATGSNFPDYPKAGIWPDAYYISTREFAGSPFAGVGAYALNRAQALAGNPSAQIIGFLTPPGATPYNLGDGLLPADMDGMTPPPVGSPNYWVGSMDNNGPYGAPQDALTFWKFTANFANPPSSSFVLTNTIPVAAFNSILGLCGGTRSCIPQPGTTNRLDHLGYRQRPLFRLAYRNFGDHEALVTNQSVSGGTGPNGEVSGIRWWELRGLSSSPVIFQEGTYAPGVTDGIHRWMASAAMDGEGNIALGYSAANDPNPSVFPSLYYTGRRPSDPLGTMAQGEAVITTGTGSQTAGGNRWGDYTSLTLDPTDDQTFWHVNEYVPTTSASGWRVRVGSFKFAANPPAPKGTGHFTVTNCTGGGALAGATVSIDGSVYGSSSATGLYDAPLAPGSHAYSISKASFGTVTGNFIIVANSTTNVSVCLVGAPVISAAGSYIVSAGANGVLDPGEVVTVALGLQNSNACTTSALAGTLQGGGGVTNPPAAQNYGMVCGGNPPVFRNFTFTVDPALACGATVTATLNVVDGATNYGNFTFAFTTGSTVSSNVQNFDGVTAPNLPPGWTTTSSGSGAPVMTSTINPDTAPNDIYLLENTTVGLSEVTSAPVAITSAGAKLSFRNAYNTESTYDGLVLEISIPTVNAGAFQDILMAGGTFASGGYNSTLNTGFGNPLPGRMAWTGLSGGTTTTPAYITSVVNLPPAATGQMVQFKWRQGSDSSIAPTNPGSRIDTITLVSTVCGGNAPTVSSAVSRKTHGAAGDFDVPLPIVPVNGAIGIEPRNGPTHTIVVTFANPVTVGSTTVTAGTGAATSTVAGNVVTINLTGVTDAQRLAVTLGNVSDGANVGNVIVPMGVLNGDTNVNGSVNGADVGQTKANVGAAVNASTFRTDVNVNGAINAADVGLVKSKAGNVLPP